MRKKLIRTLPIVVVLLLILSSTKSYSQKGIVSYDLPASYASGLTRFSFSYVPSFRIEKSKDYAVLFVRMHLVMSTASNVQGSYWYNYRYHGKDYGDEVVGRDVFGPIRVDLLRFNIRVAGNGESVPITYIKGWDEMKVGRVKLTAQPEDYHVFIEDLDYVDFAGTGPIQNKIDALGAAERKKVADEKKKADDMAADKKKQDDLEKQKQADADKKKQPEAAIKNTSQPPGNATTTKTNSTGSSSKADDDFWETGKKSSPANSAGTTVNTSIDKSKLPEFFRTTDGKYYHKDGGDVKEVSYDQYMALKKQKADQKTEQQTSANKLSPEQQQKAVDDIMAKVKADQQRTEEFSTNLVNKTNQFTQALAMGAQADDTKRELRENSSMQGSYQSVEQLMADFNQKMSSINSNVNALHQQRDASLNAMSDAMYGDAGEEVYNQGAKLIGSIINSAKEAKERKEAQARLKAQKEAALARFKAEEAKMLTGIRTDLFQRFKEGSLPLSSSKVQANTIYYFSYAYNPAQLDSKEATLYISNVFAVDRYSDGTWPFKNTIVNDLSKLTPYNEVLHGYYLSRGEAESMRNGMINIFAKTGGTTTAFAYKGKTSSGGAKAGPTDFWESGKPTIDSLQKKPVKKDDFWNN